jgi:hypothetical protein
MGICIKCLPSFTGPRKTLREECVTRVTQQAVSRNGRARAQLPLAVSSKPEQKVYSLLLLGLDPATFSTQAHMAKCHLFLCSARITYRWFPLGTPVSSTIKIEQKA